MDAISLPAFNCNLTTNFTGNNLSCEQTSSPPLSTMSNPYDEFFKFAFGSAIYMIIVSFITIIVNGLLLLVFFFDPLKIFRNATTYFLIGLAIVDILTAATQEPLYATCFIMMYTKHRDTATTCPPLLNIGQSIAAVAMNASFLIVLAFTITQYIVVISPLNYALKVTKTRVVIYVFAIYVYTIMFSVLPEMEVPVNVQKKIDVIFHSIFLIYLTIVVYILLYMAFKKKMAASKNLREDNNIQDGGRNNRQVGIERSFIIVNFLLIAILFLTSQPAAMLWIVRLYSKKEPKSPKVLIVNLMVDNLLYLKFLLDPFVYAWRIPKYRQALTIVMYCGRKEPETRSRLNDCVMAEVEVNQSRNTVTTLSYRSTSKD